MLCVSVSLVFLVFLVSPVSGHGSLFIPTPRNANDQYLSTFADGRSPATPCTCANGIGGPSAGKTGCNQGIRSHGGGQPCLWWSQGCSIGCEQCATVTAGTHPVTGTAPHSDKIGFRTRYCNSSLPATRLPLWARTMNIFAEEGSEEDSYRYNPWRAPGTAPVVDACGQAGGKYKETPIGGDSVYTTTPLATMGDLCSKVLQVNESNRVTWKAGASVEVAWGIRYNHGGGYQYRLCPANESLTEECFQRMPLPFNRSMQALVWNNGTRYPIKGVFVDEGVMPLGSTWARNPIPRVNDDNIGLANPEDCPGPNGKSGLGKGQKIGSYNGCLQFAPPCPMDTHREEWSTDGSGQGACSGDWTAGVISDHVIIPKDIALGKYALGWRWDCEETAQIWSNVADVEIVA
eukprot:m.82724 g.82724  ORF g.82724 m.82724 type:complete len:404 (-) comp21070_c0_seq3:238-1449(-)